MIKKTILMLLVLVGGVVSANAWSQMFLRSNLSSSWDTDEFEFTGSNDGSQDVYELTLTAATIEDRLGAGNDLYFRVNHYSEHGQRNPDGGKDFTFTFSNGQTQTYGPTGKGDSGAFCIPHSSIKASSYKITVYYKYNDGNKFYIKVDILGNVSAEIKSGNSYATFSTGAGLDFTNITTVKAYTAALSQDGTKVVLTRVTGKVPPKTGLILAGETTNVPVALCEDAINGNLLHASTGSAIYSDNLYSFVKRDNEYGFAKVGTGYTWAKGKAYLEATPSNNAPSLGFVFDDDETATIHSIAIENNEDGVMYNLSGQRIDEPTKGVYVVNGKKVIVK